MPKITIDQTTVEVTEGTTVIQACDALGVNVPRYCYHPGLSIAGNCRMCLVEVEKSPKLQIACNVPVVDGMVVHTQSDRVKKARQEVLEFLLTNHPLDCPVCDQAGECELQNYYMDHGLYDPRFEEQKTKKPKVVKLGPTVMLDAERCILCSRCERFTDEISKTGEFGIFNRGSHAEIGLYPGKVLDNKYSGNVVDICPVGALTDRDFRFKSRVWYLKSAPSICTGCSKGCNIDLHYVLDRPYLADGARAMRVKPRYHPDVNQWWICDEGRYGYKFIDQARLTQPQSRSDDQVRSIHWSLAISELASRLNDAKQNKKLDRWGVIPSPQLTNEELYLIRTFFKEKLGLACSGSVLEVPGESDGFLIQADRNPNRRGMEEIGLVGPKGGSAGLIDRALKGEISELIVFGHDLVMLYGEDKVRELVKKTFLVFVGSNENGTSRYAHLILPSAVAAEKEGTFVNSNGRVQRFRKAFDPLRDAKSESEIILELANELQDPLPFGSSGEIFFALSEDVTAFDGLSYEKVGAKGALLSASRTSMKRAT